MPSRGGFGGARCLQEGDAFLFRARTRGSPGPPAVLFITAFLGSLKAPGRAPGWKQTPWSIRSLMVVKVKPRGSCAAGNKLGHSQQCCLKMLYLLFCSKTGVGGCFHQPWWWRFLGAPRIPSHPRLESFPATAGRTNLVLQLFFIL